MKLAILFVCCFFFTLQESEARPGDLLGDLGNAVNGIVGGVVGGLVGGVIDGVECLVDELGRLLPGQDKICDLLETGAQNNGGAK